MKRSQEGLSNAGQLHFRVIETLDGRLEAYQKLGLDCGYELWEIEQDFVFLLALYRGNDMIGLGSGAYKPTLELFAVQYMMIIKQERTPILVQMLIQELLKRTREKYGIKEYTWLYTTADDQRDPLSRMMTYLPDYSVKSRILYRTFRMEPGDTVTDQHFSRKIGESVLKEMGITLCSIREWKEDIWRQFRGLLETADHELRNLLPFDTDNNWDQETSFAAVDAKTGELAGWILCRRVTEEEIEIRRFYVLPHYREKGLGNVFGGYMMLFLAEKARYIQSTVMDGNTGMLFFLKRYFRGSVELLRCRREMTISYDVRV